MNYEFEILDTENGYQGFFRLDRVHLRHSLFAGGWCEKLTRELLVKGHAAAVLLYDPHMESVVLVEQFRIGAIEESAGAWVLELAAGFIEPGESAEQVAQREVYEETGCTLLDLIPVHRFLVSPGSTTENIHLYCGRVDASRAGGIFGITDEGEDIRVKVLKVDEAFNLLDTGSINSATPIIGLQWLRLNQTAIRERWLDRTSGS